MSLRMPSSPSSTRVSAVVIPIVFFGISYFAMFGVLRGQSSNDMFDSCILKKPRRVVVVYLNGTTQSKLVDWCELSDPAREYSVLRCQEFLSLLNLSSNTRQRISTHLKSAESLRQSAFFDIANAPTVQQRDEECSKYIEHGQKAYRAISRLLTNSQKKQVDQFVARQNFFSQSLSVYLQEQGKRTGKSVRELTEKQRSMIKEIAKSQLEKVVAHARKTHKQQLDRIFDCLDAAQAETLHVTCRSAFQVAGEIDVLKAQLKIRNVLPRKKAESGDLFSAMLRPAMYTIENGELVLFQRNYGKSMPIHSPDAEWTRDLLYELRTKELGQTLGITDEQSQRLLDAQIEMDSFIDYATLFVTSADNMLLARETVVPAYEHANQKAAEKIDSILTPAQRKKLIDLVDITDMMKFGLMHQLIDGGIGKKLSLTNEQKSNIKREALTSISELGEAQAKMEDESVRALLSVLDASQKDSINSIIGSRPKESSVGYTMIKSWLELNANTGK